MAKGFRQIKPLSIWNLGIDPNSVSSGIPSKKTTLSQLTNIFFWKAERQKERDFLFVWFSSQMPIAASPKPGAWNSVHVCLQVECANSLNCYLLPHMGALIAGVEVEELGFEPSLQYQQCMFYLDLIIVSCAYFCSIFKSNAI